MAQKHICGLYYLKGTMNELIALLMSEEEKGEF